MKTRALTTSMIFATLFSLSPAAFAHDGHNHGEHAQPGKTAATPLATGQGVVKKIDLPNQRLTLAHDPIAQLNWPAMTMPFAVTDKALL
ncbi:MAG: copper-binding protein, partial [Zoogloeaceae bacterium]|nr:copper-binding protein [Zoogloeaceae bacterium]